MKRSRLSKERRAFEHRTLDEFAAAGATPAELARLRWVLCRGRKIGLPLDAAEERAADEKAGIAAIRGALRGEPESVLPLLARMIERRLAA